MAHLLEDVYFACDSLNVALVFYFVLFEDFNRNHLVGDCVSTDPHLAECALSERATYTKVKRPGGLPTT